MSVYVHKIVLTSENTMQQQSWLLLLLFAATRKKMTSNMKYQKEWVAEIFPHLASADFSW